MALTGVCSLQCKHTYEMQCIEGSAVFFLPDQTWLHMSRLTSASIFCTDCITLLAFMRISEAHNDITELLDKDQECY